MFKSKLVVAVVEMLVEPEVKVFDDILVVNGDYFYEGDTNIEVAFATDYISIFAVDYADNEITAKSTLSPNTTAKELTNEIINVCKIIDERFKAKHK